jgi:hypothetical protein
MDRFVYSLFLLFLFLDAVAVVREFLLREMAVEPVVVWIHLLVVIINLFLYFTYGLLYYVMD